MRRLILPFGSLLGLSLLFPSQLVNAIEFETNFSKRVADNHNRISLNIPEGWKYVAFSDEVGSMLFTSNDPQAINSFDSKFVQIKVSKEPIPVPTKYKTCGFKKVHENFPITKDKKVSANLTVFGECSESSKDWYTTISNKSYPEYNNHIQVIVQRNQSNPKVIDDVTKVLNTSNVKLIVQ